MNENANYFACAMSVCSTFSPLANPPIAYYVTICKFDKPTPSGNPYTQSANVDEGCSATSCDWTLTSKTDCSSTYTNLCCK